MADIDGTSNPGSDADATEHISQKTGEIFEVERPWFSDRDVDVLFYKVNRRPMTGDPSLFDPPTDLLAHMQRVLDQGEPATSGRNPKRRWQIGNLVFDHKQQVFTGQLGWARSAEALGRTWDSEEHKWVDQIVSREDSAVSPIAFTKDGRCLGVLKHRSFTTETVLDTVLTEIFNRGEKASGFPITAWSVEPLGNESDFFSWLDGLDQLTSLRLVFQRPNPDGEDAFQEIFDRLDALRAESITEEYKARDKAEGLDRDALKSDRVTQGFIRASMIAFGRLLGRGQRGGVKVKYDQREEVLRTSLADVGDDWETATVNVLNAVRGVTKDRKKDGSA